MKKVITIFICFLFLCGCQADGGYKQGYADGYGDGYRAALANVDTAQTRSEPVLEATATPRATAAATPKPTAAPSTDSSMTVYVSRSFTIHKNSNCSGMKHYTEMTLSQALSFGYKKCSKCWK